MAIDPNMLIAALAGTMGGNPMGVNAGGMPQPMQAAPLSLAPPKPPGLFARMGQNFQNAGGLEALMGNPLFGAGIGAMSAGRNGNPYQAALAGMYGSQLYKQRTQENELRMQEAKEQRERAMTVAKLAQEGLKTLDVDQDGNISPAEQARGDYLRAAAQTGDQSFLTKATDQLASLQPKPSAFEEKAKLLGIDIATLTPEQKVAALGGGVNVNMGAIGKPVGADAIEWRMPDGSQPNPMMTVADIAAAGGRPIPPEQRRPPTVEEAAKASASEDSITMLDRLGELTDSGSVPLGPAADVWRGMRSPQEDAGAARKVGAEAIGRVYPLSQPEAEAMALAEKLSTVLLQAIRGAQVGPMEQAKFEKQLPRLGQPESLFKENLRLTRRNLEYLTKRRQELRSAPVGQSVEQETNVVDWESLQ